MAPTTTIRELRNQFPKVRRLVEEEGEVLVTERGTPRYRLIPYRSTPATAAAAKDYLTRVRRHQPRPLSARASRALDQANRGPR